MFNKFKNRIKTTFCCIKDSSKGFSLIELIIVMAIIVIVASITGSALGTVIHARAKQASKTVSSLLSECKIDNLSGHNYYFYLHFDGDEGSYSAEIRSYNKANPEEDGASGRIVKNESFGNKTLEISINDNEIADTGDLEISFNGNTGAIKACKYNGASLSAASDGSYDIKFNSSSSHAIKLYKATGAQVTDY